MATLVVNYALGGSIVANPDGSLPASVVGGSSSAGPGETSLGSFVHAAQMGAGASVQVDLPAGALDATAFSVRVLFKPAAVTGRQNLVENTQVPFALFLEPGTSATTFHVVGTVQNAATGWVGCHTRDRKTLAIDQWHIADLIFDGDTLGLAVDGEVLAVCAWPDGLLATGSGAALVIGAWVDRQRFGYEGAIASVQVYSGLTDTLNGAVDEKRNAPEWHLTRKYNSIRGSMNFGALQGDFVLDSAVGSYVQVFEHGRIQYTPGYGVAFEIHGAILDLYNSDAALRSALGPLLSDEIPAKASGARKSRFTRGSIYCSAAVGAVPVLGQVYVSYEGLGESSHAIGMPRKPEVAVDGGRMQEFERGRMYHRLNAPVAFEVHGAILDRFLATGDLAKWGFPTSDELPVRSGPSSAGRVSGFEKTTFYWSSATGAHEVHGLIRDRYQELNGPLGKLGFPTSSETDIPDVSGYARYNTFSGGSILYVDGNIVVCEPFRVRLGLVRTDDTDNDLVFYKDDTDIFLNARLRQNGHLVRNQRFPSAGAYDERTSQDLASTLSDLIVPNQAELTLEVEFDVWDEDGGLNGADEHLGTYRTTLNLANGWGIRNNPSGLQQTGRFGKVQGIDWAVVPEITPSTPFDFWNVKNIGTPDLTWDQMASTYRNVDPDAEAWDPSDWMDGLFYEAAYRGIANGGNCFGMSLEAIYAWKGLSLLTRPLIRYGDWEPVKPHFNRKQGYQIGAECIYWFLGQFATGNTHDPVAVFHASRAAYESGQNPVLSVSQNFDFSGKPHTILPIAWDDSSKPWKITVFDPNSYNTKQTIFIDPDANTYSYSAGNVYTGGSWSGGRLHYIPFSVLNQVPSNPLDDLLHLLLGGTLLLVSGHAETTSLVDGQGKDLLGTNVTGGSVASLKNRFVPIRGSFGSGALQGELFVRGRSSREIPRTASTSIGNPLEAVNVFGRGGIHSSHEVAAVSVLGGSVVHTLRGRTGEPVSCAWTEKLSELGLRFDVQPGQNAVLRWEKMGAAEATVQASGYSSSTIGIKARTRLGLGGDLLKVTLDSVPVQPAGTISMRVQPGIGTVDLSGALGTGTGVMRITGTRAGVSFDQRWQVPVAGGTRIQLSEALGSSVLKVGRIDQIAGPVHAVQRVRPS